MVLKNFFTLFPCDISLRGWVGVEKVCSIFRSARAKVDINACIYRRPRVYSTYLNFYGNGDFYIGGCKKSYTFILYANDNKYHLMESKFLLGNQEQRDKRCSGDARCEKPRESVSPISRQGMLSSSSWWKANSVRQSHLHHPTTSTT